MEQVFEKKNLDGINNHEFDGKPGCQTGDSDVLPDEVYDNKMKQNE